MSRSLRASLITFVIVAASSLFFCSKAIFVKLAYRYDLDAVTILALRMSMALPFFLIGGYLATRQNPVPLTRKDWFQLAALGFCGWYLSSVVNFIGLKHVSVGLERMILYTYPSLVVIGSVLFLGKPLRCRIIIAMLISYLGIVIAYRAEAASHFGQNNDTLLGASLIFASAITYAVFVLLSGQIVKRIGPTRFTSCVVGFSCLFILIHFALTHPLSALTHLPAGAYGCGLLLATLGTVIPSYLFGIGIQRAGSQAFSIIGMIGPLGTVVLAWWLLGETVSPVQVLGLLLTLAGGVAVSLVKT
jgi:drug/metabolite transporter (DMT)-like permease